MILIVRANEMLRAVGHDGICELPLTNSRTTVGELRTHWSKHFDEQKLKDLSREQMIEQSRMIDEFLSSALHA